ncbi:MAG: aldo/keto reductase [Chthoniobacter sp.]|uniref:aldo/keto reductase n=1 Tax=Chthoniobacter sp. TaxID=2510640 RepID=UPI0032AB91F5
MKKVPLGDSKLQSSRLAYGCWRIARTGDIQQDLKTTREAVNAAIDSGYTLFDHADIYCHGRAESAFGEVLRENPKLRKKILVATKCGIRMADEPPGAPQRYDFTAEHIIRSCEQSLQRLHVEHIDLYQLHRPDYLMDVDEVALAFTSLHKSGKVREFGVSNFRPSQVSLLQRALQQKLEKNLVTNQVEISLAQLTAFEDGTLDQCQAMNITPMAWSPLAGGLIGDGATDVLPSQKGYPCTGIIKAMDDLAKERNTSRTTIAIAWLLKHPTKIIPIIGSTNPERIRAAAAGAEIELTREEWYRLLVAARGEPLP